MLRSHLRVPLPKQSVYLKGDRRAPRFFHKDYNPTREDRSCTLPSGQTIGFAVYGPSNPRHPPAFFLHGSPGCRYDGLGLASVALRFSTSIICPDRPGHGLSSFRPNRKLSDYAEDISALARHLGISKYHVIGQSGGGPYVLACAYGLPEGELLNAAVIAGMGPPEVVTVRDAGWYTVAVLGLVKYFPGVIRSSLKRWSLVSDERLQRHLTFMYRFLAEEDRKRMEDPETQAIVLKILKEAYHQGPDGVMADSGVYARPWDFRLEDVTRKVMLFYGKKDARTPIAFGRYYKEHLPNAELVELEDATHFSMDRYNEVIFAKIFGKSLDDAGLNSLEVK